MIFVRLLGWAFTIETPLSLHGVARGGCLLALAALSTRAASQIKAGFGQDPPLHYTGPSGRAAGFIVDAVNEAARREGIQVVWQPVAGSHDIEPALQEGRIDIFPSAIVTQVRRSNFWVSEPWWTEDLSILARADIGNVRQIDWRRQRVVLPSEAYASAANEITPGATFEILTQSRPPGSLRFGVSLICNSGADAALIPHSTVDEFLAKRSANCLHTDFRIVETDKSLPLAVMARWDHSQFAERIRSRIDEMALDGTLVAVASRYPRTPARSAVMLAETFRLRYKQKLLWFALFGMLLLAVLATALLTRQIRIQRKLRRTMAAQIETEQVLRTRTRELTVSNEELQAFAYSVSHDLQEPLRTIGLYSQLVERHFPHAPSEAKEHLVTIRRHALRMQEMLEQLLLLSRVSRSEVRPVTVSLREVLSNVLQDLDAVIASSLAEIVIGPMPSVMGWPDRLSVVFQNLIGNALKYRKDDVPPRIEIGAVNEGTEWVLSVADNGIGFEQKYAEKIFGVFRRLHVQDQYGGTGVGLAIVKRVVERHGGHIWAKSKPGEGSTFYLTLPKHPSDKAGDKPAREHSEHPAWV